MNPNRMSDGNSKIKGNVLVFSLPPIDTCPNCSECAKTCYAMKAQRMYANTRKYRAENFELAKNNREELMKLLSDQIQKKFNATKKRNEELVVRIHEAGDFFSQDYLNLWTALAFRFPDVSFWGYTKTRHLWNFTVADKMPNLNIINSFIDGKYLNYGSKEYVDGLLEKDPECYLCPATTKEGHKKIFCSSNCKLCIKGRKPVFYIH
jgi:hypothetical protein